MYLQKSQRMTLLRMVLHFIQQPLIVSDDV